MSRGNVMALLITKLLPTVLIILIGILLQKAKDISVDVIAGFKFIIINIALPCILFFAFLETELEYRYMFLFGMVFLFCCGLYGIGILLKKWLIYEFTPGFFTGFEFGMVGIALFTAIWGVEKLPIISLIGLGHEVFIWFVYVPLLEYTNSRQVNLLKTLRSFLRSPIIIAIVLGIVFNVMGLFKMINQTILGQGVFNTLHTLSLLTVPLILIVIGYSLTFDQIDWKRSFCYVVLRLGTVLTLGTIVYFLIIGVIGDVDQMFAKAFYGFILLPPPYILPLFIKENEKEVKFFSNVTVLYTFVSFFSFVILMFI